MTEPVPAPRSPRRRLLWAATAAFILIAAAYGAWWMLVAAHFESTDDAYVHGDLVPISARIPGTVIAIGADDNHPVAQGAPLVRLDPSDTAITLAQAEAALAQAVRRTQTLYVQNDALTADVAVGEANVEQAQTQLDKARNDLQRRKALRGSGGVSGEEVLHAEVAVKSAQAALAQAQAQVSAAKARLATNQALTQGSDVAHHPDVLQAADQLRQAWLAQSRTTIAAPVDGMVAQRSVQLGQRIQPGTPLMTVVPLHRLWVEANFKETQLRRMQPGQSVTLVSDLYGKAVRYHGTVQGVSAGSGSAFALLPPQNASGNWIKVIQRVPVRIALDAEDLRAHPLRVGLSMTAKVDLASGPQTADAPASAAPAPLQSTPVFDADPGPVDALIRRIIAENQPS